MDSLFIMQRYWGSDEENEEKSTDFTPSNFSSKKEKLYSPVIDTDNEKNSGKKRSNKKNADSCNSSQEIDNSISNKQFVANVSMSSSHEITQNETVSERIINSQLKDAKLRSNSTTPKGFLSDVMAYSLTENMKNTDVDSIVDTNNKQNSRRKRKKSKKNSDSCNDHYDSFISNSDSQIEIANNINNSSSHKIIDEIHDNVVSKAVENSQLKSAKLRNSDKTATSMEIATDVIADDFNINENIKNISDLDPMVNANSEKRNKRKRFKKNPDSCSNNHETDSFISNHETQIVNNVIKSSSQETTDYGTHVNNSTSNVDRAVIDNKMSTELQDKLCTPLKTTSQEFDTLDVKSNDQAFCTIGKPQQQKDKIIKHALPSWLTEPIYVSINLQEENIPISELHYLESNTKKNLTNAGINFLFPVQLAVVPWLMRSADLRKSNLEPSDICVSVPTGSGKTLSYVLPMIQCLKRDKHAIRALVVLPVSELAFQVFQVFKTFTQGTYLKVAILTGKKSFVDEQNSLVRIDGKSVFSKVDIVVGTPGRIHDHIYRTKGFCLKRLEYIIIDEADRVIKELQEGWLKHVEDAVFRNNCISSECVCSNYKRQYHKQTCAANFSLKSVFLQKLLFSATLIHNPEQLHSLSLWQPKLFTVPTTSFEQEYKGSCSIPSELTVLQVHCEEGIKPMVICHLIKHHNFKKVLCYAETVERTHRLKLVIEEMGLLKVREISSFKQPVQRKIMLKQFRSGKIDILVCSDLVARGIDIENVDCVISYDAPHDVKTFVHRIGRTARAGKTGKAITLLSKGEVQHFKKIIETGGIKMPEEIYINSEDLKPLVDSYKSALSIADAKIKKEKERTPRKSKKSEDLK